MDFTDELKQFSDRILSLKDKLQTEEATKTSFVLPFFSMLGYDVFNPLEFVPEFIADVGTKKGEKVDYAILQNDDPIMIIEVKSCGSDLNCKHINQLYRYFTVTKARFAILTNGIIYRFFSDLEESNKMDTVPFLEVNLLDLNDKIINELKHFRKDSFDIQSILSKASELKYTLLIKNLIAEQFANPSDQFVKALITKDIYSGTKTQVVLDRFREIIKSSFTEYINDLMHDKFRTLISIEPEKADSSPISNQEAELDADERATLEYVSSLVPDGIETSYSKTSRYCYLQLNGNSRKWICRIYKQQSQNLFILHKYNDTYENEYFFDDVEQLHQIEDIIKKVINLCINS